jgi:TolA-binding protein
MENVYDNIDNYIDGTLSAADVQAFEQAMAIDKNLAQEVAFYQDLTKGVEVGADFGLKNMLQTVQNGLTKEGFFLNDNDIDLFIDGHLEADKVESFYYRLQQDADFAAEVEMQQDLRKGIEMGADSGLRNALKDVQHGLEKENFFAKEEKTAIVRTLNTEGVGSAKVRRLGVQWWAAAASIALLITASIWYLSPSKPATYDNIAAQYFQAENERVKDIYAELSADGFAVDKARNNSLKAALEVYQSKNYSLAKDLFEKHVAQYKDDVDAQFYLAMTYLSLNEKEKATPYLESLLNKNTTWANDATWHLALIYWNMPEKHDVAVAYLTNIAENKSSEYQAKAVEILNKK